MFGVHTIHALKHGRDVVAVDAEPLHLQKLRERVSQIETPGRLCDAIVATLPCCELFKDESFAGVLVSEVIHFLPPGGPLQLFKDIYRWLMPGGTLVTTCMSPSALYDGGGRDFKYNGNLAYDRALELFTNVPDDIVELAPGFVELSPALKNLEIFPDNVYFMTCEEVRAFAKMAGFSIETCTLYRTGTYQVGNVLDNDVVLLVAKKAVIS
ncbi:Methyltransferase [Gracilaria domingensis]|nr:Methyltransferase [Gracilaria domingensis]